MLAAGARASERGGMESLDQLFALQVGVVSRRQLLARGHVPSEIRRMLRRRELSSVLDGVYVNHTGPLSWIERAWAAVLFSWPAALTHDSAVRAANGPGRRTAEDVIHVAVATERHLKAPSWVRLHRLTDFQQRVQWNLGPPRLRYDDAVLSTAADAPADLACLGVLAEAVQGRRTTARRLLAQAHQRNRLACRRWITSVLADIAEGTHSVLEHGYLRHVERAHGLARARRQQSSEGVYRDVEYATGLVVELDGRLFHDNAAAREHDFDRDLDAAVAGLQTVRLTWGQVFGRPCRTADRISALLRRGGWAGRPRRCGPDCLIVEAIERQSG